MAMRPTATHRILAAIAATTIGAVSTAMPAHGSTLPRAARPTIRIIDRTMYVPAEGTLVIRVAITDAPHDATLNLFLGKKLTSIQALDSPIDQQFSGRNLYDARPDIMTSPRDASGNLELSIKFSTTKLPNTDDVNVRLKRPGVYPVGLELVDVDEQVVASTTTQFVRSVDEAAPRNVAATTVAHLQAFPTVDANGRTVVNHDDLVQWTATLQFLADRPEIPVALSLPIDFVDALDGTNAEQSALITLLDKVIRNPKLTLVSSPAFSIPINEAVTSGLTQELTNQIDAGRQKLTARFSKSVDEHSLVVADTLTQTGVSALNLLGYTKVIDGGRSTPAALPAYSAADVSTKIVTPNATVLVATSGQRFSPALERTMLEWSIRTIADTDQPGNAVTQVIDLTSAVIENSNQFDALITALLTSPIGRLVPLAEVPLVNAPQFQFNTQPTPRELGSVAKLQAQAKSALDDVASLDATVAPTQIKEMTNRLTYLIASRLSDDQRRSYVDVISNLVTTASRNVSPLGDETFTLTSRQGEIPLTVVNTGTTATQATLHLDSSDRLSYPAGDTLPVTLQPGKNQVRFSVRAKTSGVQTILVRITTPNGRIEFARGRITIRSTVVSGVGIMLSALSLAVLLMWWIRHWRKARPPAPSDAIGQAVD